MNSYYKITLVVSHIMIIQLLPGGKEKKNKAFNLFPFPKSGSNL